MSDIGSNISAFPIHEYWLDMGIANIDELKKIMKFISEILIRK